MWCSLSVGVRVSDSFFFFFQAEDGIRDVAVTGVQTCALPISLRQDGSFDCDIGFDLSSGLLYRPFLNNNVQLRAGGGTLFVNNGFENLFGNQIGRASCRERV